MEKSQVAEENTEKQKKSKQSYCFVILHDKQSELCIFVYIYYSYDYLL